MDACPFPSFPRILSRGHSHLCNYSIMGTQKSQGHGTSVGRKTLTVIACLLINKCLCALLCVRYFGRPMKYICSLTVLTVRCHDPFSPTEQIFEAQKISTCPWSHICWEVAELDPNPGPSDQWALLFSPLSQPSSDCLWV